MVIHRNMADSGTLVFVWWLGPVLSMFGCILAMFITSRTCLMCTTRLHIQSTWTTNFIDRNPYFRASSLPSWSSSPLSSISFGFPEEAKSTGGPTDMRLHLALCGSLVQRLNISMHMLSKPEQSQSDGHLHLKTSSVRMYASRGNLALSISRRA